MVEYAYSLDTIFGALANPTRRDILQRLSRSELMVTEVAEPYSISFAAVSKHLKVLENAKLVIKRKRGTQNIVQLTPEAFADAKAYIDYYQNFWESRLDALENYMLNKENK